MIGTLHNNRYNIIKLLGSGGFADVYLVNDTKTNVQLALKVYNKMDQYGSDIFKQEYAKIADLNHQRLLTARHFEVVDKQPYLVLPFCKEGGLTKHLVSTEQDMEEEEIAQIILQIAEGLEYLHKNGIVHRDLKPDNVLYKSERELVISDFGVSQRLKSTLSKSIKATAKQAMEGYTPPYAPPERELIQTEVKSTFDIFSFGILIYEMATKKLPFTHTGRAVELGESIPNLPSHYTHRLGQLIQLCLDKDPGKRPTAVQLKKWAAHFIEHKHWPNALEKNTKASAGRRNGGNEENPKKQKNTLYLIFGGFAILILGAGLWWFWPQSEKNQKQAVPIGVTEKAQEGEELVSTQEERIELKEDSIVNTSNISQETPKDKPNTIRETEKVTNTVVRTTTNEAKAWNSEQDFIPKNELQAWVNRNGLESLIKAAEQGNVIAQRRLGRVYAIIKDNDVEAIKWYRKAAEKEDIIAQYNLGVQYYYGYGISKNYEKALEWYRKAAAQGDADAQTQIGYMYDYGQGVPQDKVEATKWYRKGAEQGLAWAQNNLGDQYENGEGIPQDYEEALKWYQKAADQGHARAMDNIGDLYDQGNGVQKNLETAFEWYQKAADGGDENGMFSLAWGYDYGRGVETNWAKARQWYQKAADEDHVAGTRKLGEFYLFGEGGVTKNTSTATDLFEKAKQKGDKIAEAYLQVIYDIVTRESVLVGPSNYGNSLSLTQESKNAYTQFPYNFTKSGTSWRFNVSYVLGQSEAVQIWPAGKSLLPNEIHGDYTLCPKLTDKTGTHNTGVSDSDNREKSGYRAIGYFYYRGHFYDALGDVQETLVLKVPVMLCWKPKNEY